MIEISFELPALPGNPFDFTENDIRVTLGKGKAAVSVPAFFDGGTTWRARFTPRKSGAYAVASVACNGKPVRPMKLAASSDRASAPKPGFVGRDPKNPARLIHQDGSGYYPVGHNVAWRSGKLDIVDAFAKMSTAGENWARVWMCHWGETNLDWGQKYGQLSLPIARRWDMIVASAEKNKIYFQPTLQHHGPYSSNVNSNWGENPWNKANGGFLSAPEEFFTHPQAIALTKLKYRYILARYGHSPNILAWELFNEVEWCDAVKKNPASVAAWHREMASFLRQHDVHGHLITTSSDRSIPGLYDAVDIVQPHRYAPDALSAALSVGTAPKPIFYGEIGPSGDLNAEDGTFLRDVLWASLVSASSGAAQYWSWENVDARNLYPTIGSAAGFVKASGLASKTDLSPLAVEVKTPGAGGSVRVGPGGNWGTATQTRFVVGADGSVPDAEKMPSFLQGDGHREVFPFAEFEVNFAEPGTFSVRLNQISKAGATVKVSIDGAVVAEKNFPASNGDRQTQETVTAQVPAGKHVVRLENAGADWLVFSQLTFAPYGPALRALGKAGKDLALLYLKAADGKSGATGTVTIPGRAPGRWEAVWWDVTLGKPVKFERVAVGSNGKLALATPPVSEALAAFIRRV